MRIMKKIVLLLIVALLSAGFTFAEGAQEESPADASTDTDTVVDFAEVQWSDIASTTAATRIVLEAMGYETTSKIVAVPIAFQSLSTVISMYSSATGNHP